jgi:hypothetical protein
MVLTVEIEQEADGRGIAEMLELLRVMEYGPLAETAVARVKAVALRVVADRLKPGEAGPELVNISLRAAQATGSRGDQVTEDDPHREVKC